MGKKYFQRSLSKVLVIILLAGSWGFPSIIRAQTNFGQINGTVYDQSGNVIPGAQITLTDLGTGTVRKAKSAATGTYFIPSVPPAQYSLTVSAPGFKTYEVGHFQLLTNQARTFDARLVVGAKAQTVQVSAAPVAINKTDATIGAVILHQEIVQLPLDGRNFSQLMLLSPGVSTTELGQQTVFNITGGFSPAVNGMRHMMNNFTFDGIEDNMRFTNAFSDPPPPDALEEFKISSHQSSAAASLAAGANVNLVSRSGTNSFHGSAWDFLRNNAFTANGFFNNYFGIPKQTFHQNQFGFFVGGPVFIPHVMDGRKSRTYFAGYYQGTRFLQNVATTATVPDQAERGGDFSELLGPQLVANGQPAFDCLGRPILQGQLYNPLTTRPDSNCPQGVIRDPFQNNIIPSSLINSVAQAYLKFLYPLPNRSGVPNLVLAQRTDLSSNQWGVRLDHNFTDKQLFFARVSLYNYTKDTPGALPANPFQQVNSGANVATHYTFIASPTLLFDTAAGYNRATIPYRNVGFGSNWQQAVGSNFAVPVPTGFLPTSQNLFGSRYTFAQFVNYDLANPDDSYQVNEDVKKVASRHTLDLGIHIVHWRHHVGPQGTSNMNYSNETSGLPGFGLTGESIASFFLGYPTQTSFGFAPPQTTHGNIYIGYAGDTWKVRPDLTLDLGLQYVYASPPVGNNLSLMDFGKAKTQPLATNFAFAYLWASTNPITGAPPNTSRGIMNPDRNNFAPRIGVAYSITRNTVIRTGFGVFYDYNTNLIQNSTRGFKYPFSVTQSIAGQNLTTLGPASPPISFSNPYAPSIPGVATLGGAIDIHRRDPYAMEWNFGIERELPAGMMLSVNYVGSGGRKLVVNTLENIAPAGPAPINPRRPWPNDPVAFFYIQDLGTSNYNALQVELEKELSRGLTFRNSYTYSKSLDLETDPNTASDIDYTYNRRLSYGPSEFDLRHENVTSLVYNLPVGRGNRFASQISGPLDEAIGGWQLSGIVTLHTGIPYYVLAGQDIENTGNYIAFATEPANKVSSLTPPGFVQNQQHWFNPSAFALPTFGTIGNVSRDSFTGPGFVNFDLALMKDFKIRESLGLQFRSEFFNAFNRTNFGNPTSSLASPNLGKILSAYAARDIQFALKLHW